MDLDHPMAQVIREDESARGRIRIHRDNQGRLMTVHTLWGGRSVQRKYLRQYATYGTRSLCGRPEPIHVESRMARWLLGPCRCDGLMPPCGAVHRAIRQCDVALPGRNRLDGLEFAGEKTRAVAVYFEREVPPFGHERTVSVRALDSPLEVVGAGWAGLDPVESQTLREALRLGYYDSPRRTTMEHLAESLGITKSAVCRRLNKLERTAIVRLLGAEGEQEDRSPYTSEWTKSEVSREGRRVETRATA